MKKLAAACTAAALLGLSGIRIEIQPDAHTAVTVEFRTLSETAEELRTLGEMLCALGGQTDAPDGLRASAQNDACPAEG